MKASKADRSKVPLKVSYGGRLKGLCSGTCESMYTAGTGVSLAMDRATPAFMRPRHQRSTVLNPWWMIHVWGGGESVGTGKGEDGDGH